MSNVSLINGHIDEVKKSCKDCLHNEICLEQYKGLNQEMMFRECKRFKSKEDLVEVKHGEWNPYPSDAYMKCSVCGMEYLKSKMPQVVGYCPNCGAKMDGERRGKE